MGSHPGVEYPWHFLRADTPDTPDTPDNPIWGCGPVEGCRQAWRVSTAMEGFADRGVEPPDTRCVLATIQTTLDTPIEGVDTPGTQRQPIINLTTQTTLDTPI
jgi:hypothetical protein